jgi:hypothetical protein
VRVNVVVNNGVFDIGDCHATRRAHAARNDRIYYRRPMFYPKVRSMDMTNFSFIPKSFKQRNLKIAVVFIHEAFRFEAWLAGYNKQVQTNRGRNLEIYQ